MSLGQSVRTYDDQEERRLEELSHHTPHFQVRASGDSIDTINRKTSLSPRERKISQSRRKKKLLYFVNISCSSPCFLQKV